MVAIEYKPHMDGNGSTRKQITDLLTEYAEQTPHWDQETPSLDTMKQFYYVDPDSSGLVIVKINQRDHKPVLRFSRTRGTPLSSIEQAVLELNGIKGLELVPTQ